jgi:centriolar protein POC1
VTSVAFHHSGNFFMSASEDATVKIWDVREGRLLFTVHGHAGPISQAAFSMEGNSSLFATAGAEDQTVMVWKSNLAPYNRSKVPSSATASSTTTRTGGRLTGAATATATPTAARTAHVLNARRIARPAYQRPSQEAGEEEEEEPPVFGGKRDDTLVDFSLVPPTAPPAAQKEAVQEEEEEQPRQWPAAAASMKTTTAATTTTTRPPSSASRMAVEDANTGFLNQTLGLMVNKQDVMTQTVSLLAERLKMIEERLEHLTVQQPPPSASH